MRYLIIFLFIAGCTSGHYISSYRYMTHSKPANVTDCAMLEGRLEQLVYETKNIRIKAESGLFISEDDATKMMADLQQIGNEAVEIMQYSTLCRFYKGNK